MASDTPPSAPDPAASLGEDLLQYARENMWLLDLVSVRGDTNPEADLIRRAGCYDIAGQWLDISLNLRDDLARLCREQREELERLRALVADLERARDERTERIRAAFGWEHR